MFFYWLTVSQAGAFLSGVSAVLCPAYCPSPLLRQLSRLTGFLLDFLVLPFCSFIMMMAVSLHLSGTFPVFHDWLIIRRNFSLAVVPKSLMKPLGRSSFPAVVICLNRLVGLVVKAFASRAEDPGLESRLRRDFSGVESYQ